MSGQSIGGIFVVICSIISISVSTTLHTSTAIYFLIAIFVIISNIIVYFYLERSHLFQIYSSAVQEMNNEYEPLFHETSSNNYNDDSENVIATSLAIRQRLFSTYKQIKWNFLGVFLTFVLTFSIFPSSLSKIKSVNQLSYQSNRLWPDRLFVQVITFLLFFLGDTFGRIISSKIHKPSINFPRFLFFICLSRFIFLFLFLFCNFPKENGYPHIFNHDSIYAFLVVIFAISHGYCNSLNMIYAPRRISSELSGTVGALMMMVCC
jgi:equilibrative nucleoside transporter 1/2/3